MTELTELKPKEIEFEILNPATDDEIGITVKLMSPDDDRMSSIKRRVTDFNLQKQKKGKTIKAVEIEENEIELLAATLTDWDWHGEDVKFHGEKPDFTIQNVKKVLKEIPWFKSQVNEKLDDEKGFF